MCFSKITMIPIYDLQKKNMCFITEFNLTFSPET